MNTSSPRWRSLAASLIVVTTAAVNAGTYSDLLKAGDEKAASGDLDAAITQYTDAQGAAQSPTEQALALSKKAIMLTRKQDYEAAKDAANEALNISGAVAPVGRVEALQALAICQIRSDSDFPGALATLEQAAELKGVDWAIPATAMLRGDALRMSGSFPEAVSSYESITAMPDVAPATKAVAWLNIGLAQQYGLRETDKAKESYAKAVELNPGLKAEVDGHEAKIP